jgi:hypothetical protein
MIQKTKSNFFNIIIISENYEPNPKNAPKVEIKNDEEK